MLDSESNVYGNLVLVLVLTSPPVRPHVNFRFNSRQKCGHSSNYGGDQAVLSIRILAILTLFHSFFIPPLADIPYNSDVALTP